MKILFASPDRDLLECYKKILDDELGETVTAFDGTQVITLLSSEKFDVVILSCDIPRIDYKNLTVRIFEKNIPVILLTNEPINVRMLTSEPLPNEYLFYPFVPAKIINVIIDILKKISSDKQIHIGNIQISISEFRINGGPALTAGEIDILESILCGESPTTESGAYISALNSKFSQIGSESRIKYISKKGFELVTQNE